MMARPSKYTPEREAKIVEALAAGSSRRGAAEYAGIDDSTMSRWLQRYAHFADAVTRVEAEVEMKAAGAIKKGWEDGDWRAAVTWLERRRHQDWGKVDRVEIEVRRTAERIADQYPAESRPDPEWLVRRAQEIASKASEGVAG